VPDPLPYTGRSIPYTGPEALATLAYVHGARPFRGSRARVLDVGCGDGGNLLPMAFHRPEGRFVGLDVDGEAIRRARDTAAALDLEGRCRLEVWDLADADRALPAEGRFDLILSHGVHSWIDASTRDAFWALAAARLADPGLVYVSYNCLPGWGLRGQVRDFLRRRDPTSGPHPAAVAAAQALAARTAAAIGDGEHAGVRLLHQELTRVAEGEPFYVGHEYLSTHNRPFWFGEVLEAAQGAGLTYLGDALAERPEGFVPPELVETLAEVGPPGSAAFEETVDLIRFRQFRGSVFGRGPLGPLPDPAVALRRLFLGAPLLVDESFDLTEEAPQTFRSRDGFAMEVTGSLLKAILVLLATRWPDYARLDPLLGEARELLATQGFPPRGGEAVEASLLDQLTGLARYGFLRLRTEAPSLQRPLGDRPRVHALARHEAAERAYLTAATHEPIGVDDGLRAFCAVADGSRDRPALAEALGGDIAGLERSLLVAERWGLGVP
jgi:SAM-dependent methyltransferase